MIRLGEEGGEAVNDKNRPWLSIKNLIIGATVFGILAAVVAISSPGYVDRLAGLTASLVSLAVIVRDRS